MIAHCPHCQAKFRIADDKIGPRGAKVRCSRCATVFPVQRTGAATAPSPAPAPPAAPPSAAPDPFAGDPFAAPAAPPSRAPAADPFAAPDPFAAAGLGASGGDPFALETPPAAFPRPGAGDPFAFTQGAPFAPEATPAGGDPFAAEPDGNDPFAAAAVALAGAADPFAASISPRLQAPAGGAAGVPPGLAPGAAPGGSAALPLTDLSDLLGDAPAPAAPRPAGPPPLPFPARLPPEPLPPAGGLDLAFPAEREAGPSLELAASPEPAPPPAGRSTELDFSGGFEPGAVAGGPPPGEDLALEERSTPLPATARLEAPADDPFARAMPVDAGSAAGPNELSFADRGEETLALATEPSGLHAPAPPPAPARAEPPPRPAQAVAPPAPEPAREGRSVPRGGRLRSVAVNAAALAALLLVALAFRVAWRGDAPLEPGALRPSAVLGAVGLGERTAGPLAVVELRSGLYDRARGGPVLFVRGKVVSRAASTVRGVRVEVEVVRDGQVLARGSAPAGAVATAEELHGAGDAAALEAVARAAAARAAARVRPGESVPFLVALADAPEDLAGATLRVVATGGAEAAAR